MQKAITINSKEISLLKPITAADYKSKTILTDSAWEYVELWFKRQKDEQSKNALFYWQQAKHFFLASEKLPQNSKPLTSYYCDKHLSRDHTSTARTSTKQLLG